MIPNEKNLHWHFKSLLCILSRFNLSPFNQLEVQRLSGHSHWTGTAKLGAVIPPTGSPGGQLICPKRGGYAFPWGQSTSVQRYLAHIQGTLIQFLHLHPHSFSTAAVSALLFADFSSEDSLQKARLLFQPLCLEKNALENSWQESEAFLEFHSWPASLCRRVPERSHPVRSRPSEQRFQLVQPRLRSLSCSTPSAACCPPVAVSLLSLERTFAAGRTRRDWSCQRVHFRSSACCWGHGDGVPAHAPCRCQASSPLSWTGWWSFWSVLSLCWCQCWKGRQGKRTLMPARSSWAILALAYSLSLTFLGWQVCTPTSSCETTLNLEKTMT